MKLEFSKSKPDFFLLGANSTFKDKLKLEILDLEISLKTARVAKAVSDAHTRALAGGLRKALYPIVHSSISFHSIPSGLKQVNINQVYQGILPSTLMCALIDNKAIDGDLEINSFIFPHSDVESFQYYINGTPTPCEFYLNFKVFVKLILKNNLLFFFLKISSSL